MANKDVIQAMDTVRVYQSVLARMLQENKDNCDNQLILKCMMEFNKRLLGFLNELKESEQSMINLPAILRVNSKDIESFYSKLNQDLSQYNSQVKAFAKQQHTYWETFEMGMEAFFANASEAFFAGMAITAMYVAATGGIAVFVALLCAAPEIIIPLVIEVAGPYLVVGTILSTFCAFISGLIGVGEKFTYTEASFNVLSNSQSAALNDMISFTQGSFEASFQNANVNGARYAKATLGDKASKIQGDFFSLKFFGKPQTLSQTAANRFKVINENMEISTSTSMSM